jgi:hypothetical protein
MTMPLHLATKSRLTFFIPFLLSGVFCFHAYSQDENWVKQKTGTARLNVAVPDAPAFKILDESPSAVMRPADVQEVALAVAGFARTGGVLPRAFSAEFSPGMLVGGRSLTLEQYRSSPFWYRTRISAAAQRIDDGSGRRQASLGVRITLIDNADPRMDDGFLRKLSGLAQSINRVARGVQETRPTGTGQLSEPSVDQLEQQLDDLRAEQKDSLWNASVMELGAAMRFVSSDSLLQNVHADKYSGWFGASFPVSRSGQFIFGVSGTLQRRVSGSLDSSSFSISGRFYFGSNKLKFFAEAEVGYSGDNASQRLINAGGEFNAASSFWLEFSGGLEKRGENKSSIATSFNIRWSLPEEVLPW